MMGRNKGMLVFDKAVRGKETSWPVTGCSRGGLKQMG